MNEFIDSIVSHIDGSNGLQELNMMWFPTTHELKLELDPFTLKRLILKTGQLNKLCIKEMASVHEPARKALVDMTV